MVFNWINLVDLLGDTTFHKCQFKNTYFEKDNSQIDNSQTDNDNDNDISQMIWPSRVKNKLI